MVFDFFRRNACRDKNVISEDKFYDIFQKYYSTLKEINDRKGASFSQACKLELALYLLFRVDFILQNSPDSSIRQAFFEKNLKQIQGEISKDLLDICYLRLEIYGSLYNDCRDKEGNIFSKEFLDLSYNWLISAIELCKDDYKLMAREKHIPLSLGVISNYSIKICLQELDIK